MPTLAQAEKLRSFSPKSKSLKHLQKACWALVSCSICYTTISPDFNVRIIKRKCGGFHRQVRTENLEPLSRSPYYSLKVLSQPSRNLVSSKEKTETLISSTCTSANMEISQHPKFHPNFIQTADVIFIFFINY